MRFVLVIDDNEMDDDPREQIGQILQTVREQVLHGDRSRAIWAQTRSGAGAVGGFELTLGVTSGRAGWETAQ